MPEHKNGEMPQHSQPHKETSGLWQWGAPTVAALALMLVLFGYYPNAMGPKNITAAVATTTNYVAVLTDTAGRAQLTMLGAQDENKLRLKWGAYEVKPNTTMQLWAISKRDRKTRSIAIFTDASTEYLPLNNAQRGLVSDADFLLLTEEDLGGSATNEASTTFLAKGVIVRFNQHSGTQ